ncbi:hypothetical protein [Candidatus Phytoplasma solani]|uniref:Uncharacterized protein n=1 Tax=Candidatus Phytoplasma solani TaxID=69896 RepID=A0A421NXU5_9MOLU|nr:hypothetical protein [Candidatus Phytoplasma solani]RMI87705.1 hypothetical protein PSSA1_v1c6080 [Candidatus Phytoplasma solani]RMI87848.1 hypothetical protein PSSA1_v1c5410 [Candidatus Phytoplasma solani]RMI88668.1 hypothetical protein PSSA1_v1c3970 [Candidatus Phytoplasma solani]RMI88715.1 hypothetical protein PSSA1_v1c3110 [Candidatus Phytoplasma solani]RMI88728.1 hypothetical protein PSSA1_v1c3240 [Candidatus Phytoplasma solani]
MKNQIEELEKNLQILTAKERENINYSKKFARWAEEYKFEAQKVKIKAKTIKTKIEALKNQLNQE